MAPTPVFLPGKSHGQRSLAGYSPWGCRESDMTDVTDHASRKRSLVIYLRKHIRKENSCSCDSVAKPDVPLVYEKNSSYKVIK